MIRRGLFLTILGGASLFAQSSRDTVFQRTLNESAPGGWFRAHWLEDGSSFWFLQGAPPTIYKYDPVAKARTELFDVGRLRSSLAQALGHEPASGGLPFNQFTFLPGEKAARFSVEGHDFILETGSYAIRAVPDAERDRYMARVVSRAAIFGPPPTSETLSPDGAWYLGGKDGNLYLRSTTDGHIEPLTSDGSKDNGWDYKWDSIPTWAPNSRSVAAVRDDRRKAKMYPIMHWLKAEPEVEWVALGNEGAAREIYVIDVASKTPVHIVGKVGSRVWLPDSSELVITRIAAKQLDLVAVKPTTGAVRAVFSESTKTFFDITFDLPNVRHFVPLSDNRRFLWLSERDGWYQIYLYNFDGSLVRKLTSAQCPVERIVAVDEKAGWVYYTAHGGEGRPYDLHLYRVSLTEGQAQRLTEAPGQHDQNSYDAYLRAGTREEIQFAPSHQFFLDTHSDMNRAPQTDLRRADGVMIDTLAKANAAAVMALRPNPREEFRTKAADGETDLYGALYKPYDFDPQKKYPVLDFIYAGPQMTHAARTFNGAAREQAFANLGFIVFEVDARGTPYRGKVFQDVVYQQMGRNEIPDHVATLKQLSAARPYMDLSRVGVWGGSFGGYFAIRAMLQAPDVFHVGVAASSVSDLRQINVKLWMGAPAENQEAYDFASNLRIAKNLKGHLLLIHGTSDVNAPLASAIQMIDALEREGKPYDFVLMPEQDHLVGGTPYGMQAIKRYLVEHLRP